MPTLEIDGRRIVAAERATVLEAATAARIAIPTLCHRPDLTSLAGCMVCAVRDDANNRLIPSCATPAAEGMRISTQAPEALAMRRDMLGLLLSQHAADCEAPCEMVCPGRFDIPRLLRQVGEGDAAGALATVLQRLALPATLGCICPAPCEKACRRGAIDAPVAICAVKRFAGDADVSGLVAGAPTGRRVTIVGAGPTGLAAAFHLQRRGHACLILEAASAPAPVLTRETGGRLAAASLARDLDRLRKLGVVWRLDRPVTPEGARALLDGCDALVLAAGAASCALAPALGARATGARVAASRQTHQTDNPKVFSGGAAIQACHLAVTACAHGLAIAENVDAWLKGAAMPGQGRERFRSRAGRLDASQLAPLLAAAEPGARAVAAATGLNGEDARREANRCLRCDCLKKASCRFRDLCSEAGASAVAHAARVAPLVRVDTPANIRFESGKCVRCGICVRLAQRMGAVRGPAFHGRGYDMHIAPPVGRTWADIPHDVMRACAEACPTGALARMHGLFLKPPSGY